MDTLRRRLVVVRHAKSDWPPGVPDRDRPLGPRGRSDAPVMGARLRDLVGRVDVAVVSPALRAQQTWALLGPALGDVADRRVDDRIYYGFGRLMIDVLRELPDSALAALVLGHEPGVSELVLDLADDARADLRTRIGAKFPTCAAAVLTSGARWADFGSGTASLEAFTTPKGG